jgi:hypothetical protein
VEFEHYWKAVKSASTAINMDGADDYISDMLEGNRSAWQRLCSRLPGLTGNNICHLIGFVKLPSVINTIRQHQVRVGSC